MPRPLILFGAFDRHNFGDLLFPHIAAALLPGRELVYAGLAARDLRPWGGHEVRALRELLASAEAGSFDLLHVGGEILTCTAWQAAVMLLPPEEAQATLAYLHSRPQERTAWVQRVVGSAAEAPYVASRAQWPALRRELYSGVGGVGLDRCEPVLRAEVEAALQAADALSVRDAQTQQHLRDAGIEAQLLPDPVVMVAELFGAQLRARAQQGAVAHLQRQFAQGYLAVQFSAEFADDATLAQMAQQLEQVSSSTGLGIVLFRAGAAPWHDDLAVLKRTASRMGSGTVQVFESLNIWDICTLIAGSRGYCGSSLHGRIVAMACALPRVSLRSPVQSTQSGKVDAYAATWEDANAPGAVAVADMAGGIQRALAVPPAARQRTARELAQKYRTGFDALRARLG